jgi:hypothetical protein
MAAKRFAKEVKRLNIPLITLKISLVKALGNMLGATPRDSTVYHIKLNECNSAEQVAERLTLIFGEGSTMLLDVTLQECKTLKIKASGVGETKKSSTRSPPRRRRAKP